MESKKVGSKDSKKKVRPEKERLLRLRVTDEEYHKGGKRKHIKSRVITLRGMKFNDTVKYVDKLVAFLNKKYN